MAGRNEVLLGRVAAPAARAGVAQRRHDRHRSADRRPRRPAAPARPAGRHDRLRRLDARVPAHHARLGARRRVEVDGAIRRRFFRGRGAAGQPGRGRDRHAQAAAIAAG